MALAIATIASHRTHTAAIISKSSANDAWAHYQASRMKYHDLELGQSLVQVFGAKSGAADAMLKPKRNAATIPPRRPKTARYVTTWEKVAGDPNNWSHRRRRGATNRRQRILRLIKPGQLTTNLATPRELGLS